MHTYVLHHNNLLIKIYSWASSKANNMWAPIVEMDPSATMYVHLEKNEFKIGAYVSHDVMVLQG